MYRLLSVGTWLSSERGEGIDGSARREVGGAPLADALAVIRESTTVNRVGTDRGGFGAARSQDLEQLCNNAPDRKAVGWRELRTLAVRRERAYHQDDRQLGRSEGADSAPQENRR